MLYLWLAISQEIRRKCLLNHTWWAFLHVCQLFVSWAEFSFSEYYNHTWKFAWKSRLHRWQCGRRHNRINALETAQQENPSNLLLSHLNIDSIQNKFEELSHIVVESRVQIMAVSETKVDASYPDSQFYIPGYHLHHWDRKKGGGGVLMLVSSKIK